MSNSNKQTKRRAWPEKRRQKQAENIRHTKPWKQTTGPCTPEGKSTIAQNALKHGMRSADMLELYKLLHTQKTLIQSILARHQK